MIYLSKLYFRDPWVYIPFLSSVALNIFLWWSVARYLGHSSDQLFTHYNIMFGVDLLGGVWQVYALPAGGLVVAVVHAIVALFLYPVDRFLARVLAVAVGTLHLFLVPATLFIIHLNV